MNSPSYNQQIAFHYAAYRPPLHAEILKRALSRFSRFEVGLDIGCGTGYSSIALSAYCKQVWAIDPSSDMIGRATPNTAVTYQVGRAEETFLPSSSVDVVTLAGCLSYTDRSKAASELFRVCKPDGIIVVYDFEVLLDEHLKRLGIYQPAVDVTYNHAANLSGEAGFLDLEIKKESVWLFLSAEQLAHVLLSDQGRLMIFQEKLQLEYPYEKLVVELSGAGEVLNLTTDIYWAVHQKKYY